MAFDWDKYYTILEMSHYGSHEEMIKILMTGCCCKKITNDMKEQRKIMPENSWPKYMISKLTPAEANRTWAC